MLKKNSQLDDAPSTSANKSSTTSGDNVLSSIASFDDRSKKKGPPPPIVSSANNGPSSGSGSMFSKPSNYDSDSGDEDSILNSIFSFGARSKKDPKKTKPAPLTISSPISTQSSSKPITPLSEPTKSLEPVRRRPPRPPKLVLPTQQVVITASALEQFKQIQQHTDDQVQQLFELKTQLEQQALQLRQNNLNNLSNALTEHQAKQIVDIEQQQIELQLRIKTLESQQDIPNIKAELAEMRQNYAELEEEAKAKRQYTAKLKYIQGYPQLLLFYRSVQLKLNELLLGYKSAASGLVARESNSKLEHVAKGISLAGNYMNFMGSGLVFGIAEWAVTKYADKKAKNRAESASAIAITIKEMEEITEQVAYELTDRYEEQLQQLTPDGAKVLGECAVKYMFYYTQHVFPKLDTLAMARETPIALFVKSVLTEDESQNIVDFKEQTVPTQRPELNWTDYGIFNHPGIKTETDEYYSGQKTRPYKYGYRRGNIAEALTLKLNKTPQRVNTNIQEMSSSLNTLAKEQVAAVTKSNQQIQEKVERMEKSGDIIGGARLNALEEEVQFLRHELDEMKRKQAETDHILKILLQEKVESLNYPSNQLQF